MDRRLARITESGTRLSFLLMLMFIGITAYLGHYIFAGIQLFLVLVLFLYYRRRLKKRSTEMRKYVETLAFQMDDASKHTIVNFPLPMTILRIDSGEIVWGNDHFTRMVGKQESMFETHITDAIPGFDTRWLMEGKSLCPYDVEIGDRKYNIFGNMVRASSSQSRGLLATLFWIDVTEFSQLRENYEKSRPVVMLIVLDSYEELFKDAGEAEKSLLAAEIDRRISQWVSPANGIMRKLFRDRYLCVFEQKALVSLTADKFKILEDIHEVKNTEGITATVSIGIGRGEYNFGELYNMASLGIDMALSRGGDQVVIKTKNAFEFFGGRSKEVEKRTKVKSRVMANALMQLIRDSSHIFVMGHQYSDLDSIGSAAGVCAAVRKAGKVPKIIADDTKTSAFELIEKLKNTPQYQDSFITEQEAIELADASSLVIVVDTSRPEIVEGPELLKTVQRVAVIDHHRRGVSFIENSAISLHETYASSASELVAELLQYIMTPQEVLKVEAEGMLAGIFLDTKGFTIKTGVRTFEASAYLKQIGADTIEVRKMFTGGFENYIKKYNIISEAKRIFPGISLSIVDEPTARATASQAADELINITDIKASFVVFKEGEGAVVSARSYGKINVQVILEKIGGGGSLAMAGAQFADKSVAEVAQLVQQAVAEYLTENENSEE